MTLAEIRGVLLRELAVRALADHDFSVAAQEALIKRVGWPLVRRAMRRGDRIRWRYEFLYSDEELLTVERVETDRVLFDSPQRIAIETLIFCKAVVAGKAVDP